MFTEARRLSSPTGALIAYRHEAALGVPRGILLICHGLIEHSRRYQAFARSMADAGFYVYAHDHRGHGETTCVDAPLGRFAGHGGVHKVVADVRAMRDMAVAEHPRLPVVLFGHSMGGLIALNAAAMHPDAFKAVAIWNSNFNPGLAGRFAQGVLTVERMLKGSDVPSAILPKATFDAWARSIRGRRTQFDWLSRDTAEVDKYANDPLCRFDASISMWSDVLALTFRGRSAAMLSRLPRDLPFHLVGGSEDPATRGGRDILWLEEHLRESGFTDVSTRIYEDMRHETLNEIGRERAITDFKSWCDQAIGSVARPLETLS